MFCLIKCREFNRPEIRVADMGERSFEDVAEFSGECLICGPCSHVEFSMRGYWSNLGEFQTESAALAALDDALEAQGVAK
jgi:hypothetical protein